MSANIFKVLLVLSMALAAVVAAIADVNHTLDVSETGKAAYPGAADEEELTVQGELHEPTRKVYRTQIHTQVLNALVKKREAAQEPTGD